MFRKYGNKSVVTNERPYAAWKVAQRIYVHR